MVTTLDVGFKDYVVFHRGVAEASIQEDGHLHIIYQDGTDQDLGDPFGDVARAQSANAQAAVAEANTIATTVNQETKDLKAQIETLKTATEELQHTTDTSSATFQETVEAKAKETTTEVVESIDGIQKREEKDEQGNITNISYFIDVARATNADIDLIFDEE